jgi:transposase
VQRPPAYANCRPSSTPPATTAATAAGAARQARTALLEQKASVEAADAAGRTSLDPAVLKHHTRLIRDAATIAAADHTHTGPLTAKHQALAGRIRDRVDDYLRFATDFTVPFDNNPAKQEIRMAKVRQRISGGIRTMDGAQQFAAISSYTATARKHGIALIDALTRLTTGNPGYSKPRDQLPP